MEESLDLEGRLRPGLDILATEIILALKKRARYKRNPEIYAPGLVIGHPHISLLQYELNRMERIHAELGRYTFASQQPFTDVGDVQLIIKRETPASPIQAFRNNIGEAVIRHYLEWIDAYLEPGSDSDTFGEVVTTDVAALLDIFERINLGMFVAESKFQSTPEAYLEAKGDEDTIRNLLVNKEREAKVIELAARLATHYEFDPDQARHVFGWMIDCTVIVEIRYLQARTKGAER